MCEKCANIYLHERGRLIGAIIKDNDGIIWKIFLCNKCGDFFCEREDGLAGRTEPSSINKKNSCIYPG